MGKFQSKLNDNVNKKYVAIFDYEKKTKDELNIKKGDKLQIIRIM